MYYVATPEKPYPNDKLHHGTELMKVVDWARSESGRRGIDLDVRDATTSEVCVSYDSTGHAVPARRRG